MCLSIPAKIDSIDENMAICSVGASKYNASLDLLSGDDIKVGDYVLIHTGFAIQKIDAEEADRILETFDEFAELNKELDKEEKENNKRIV